MIPNVKSEIITQLNVVFMKKGINLSHYLWKGNLAMKSCFGLYYGEYPGELLATKFLFTYLVDHLNTII